MILHRSTSSPGHVVAVALGTDLIAAPGTGRITCDPGKPLVNIKKAGDWTFVRHPENGFRMGASPSVSTSVDSGICMEDQGSVDVNEPMTMPWTHANLLSWPFGGKLVCACGAPAFSRL